ncbi:segregation and condensation protein A [Peptoniphilus catoniae]|uniref:segregation and condensation protein A n=1 Tax=Peptoniphilus catoniae TaxID=1660341 RepID=UPI0010FEF0A0|nr:segregation/condensation protein A [Peptoniphilus catoniae]
MEYNISIKQYEGPMDLLLDLIKKNEIDIYDIPIHIITSQFLEYINMSKELNMELTSDFIVMASTLVEIKSKMLLPKFTFDEDIEEEEEDPRKELVDKILEYEKFREISKELKEAAEYENKTFYKLQEDFSNIDSLDFLKNLSKESLSQAFNNILKRAVDKNEVSNISIDSYSIEKATKDIKNKLERYKEFSFLSLISDYPIVEEIIVYFLSLLELVRLGEAYALQDNNFSDIKIVRRL